MRNRLLSRGHNALLPPTTPGATKAERSPTGPLAHKNRGPSRLHRCWEGPDKGHDGTLPGSDGRGYLPGDGRAQPAIPRPKLLPGLGPQRSGAGWVPSFPPEQYGRSRRPSQPDRQQRGGESPDPSRSSGQEEPPTVSLSPGPQVARPLPRAPREGCEPAFVGGKKPRPPRAGLGGSQSSETDRSGRCTRRSSAPQPAVLPRSASAASVPPAVLATHTAAPPPRESARKPTRRRAPSGLGEAAPGGLKAPGSRPTVFGLGNGPSPRQGVGRLCLLPARPGQGDSGSRRREEPGRAADPSLWRARALSPPACLLASARAGRRGRIRSSAQPPGRSSPPFGGDPAASSPPPPSLRLSHVPSPTLGQVNLANQRGGPQVAGLSGRLAKERAHCAPGGWGGRRARG